MNMLRISAWSAFILAILLWMLFGYFVWELYAEREEYVAAAASAKESGIREESASRLRSTITATEAERAALDDLLNVSVLRAVEILETTGRQAGATTVTVGEATPVPLTKAPAGMTSVSVVINLEGSFTSLVRALRLYETLTIPSTLEQFELEKGEEGWRAFARVRVFYMPQ